MWGHSGIWVGLLGSFELRHHAQQIALPAATQRLVALLALRGGALSREYVAGVLWIDHSQGSANASLRTALWRLKRLCAPVIDVSPTYLALSHDVALDVQEITEVAKHLTAGDATCSDGDLHTLMRAGELLPDWYDDWVVIDRERFRQTRLHALDSICNVLTRQGRYGLAVEVGLTAIAAEPLRESAHRAVMRAHLEEGNPGEALRQYELCRRLLHGLGLEPSIELEGLRTRCRRRDAVVTAVG